MKPVRVNTLVIDTSVFPKRPSPAELKVFFDTKLHLDMSNVKRIQLHNIKNVVYLGMRDMTVANRIASDHHLKHRMVVDGKESPVLVPVYIETTATDVRLHDLPEEIGTEDIIQHMSQYGEVISIRDELWKNFWPGLANGVTIVRMKLARHIPSYINFEDFLESSSLVTYPTQIKTCHRCTKKAHPKLRCSEAEAAEAAAENQNSSTVMAVPQTKTASPQTVTITMTSDEQSFPALPNNTPVPVPVACKSASVQKQPNTKLPAAAATPNEKQQNNKTPRIKRQLSEEQQTANKKPSASNPKEVRGDLFDTDSTEVHLIVAEMLSQCDLSAMPGTETEKQQCILDSARYFAKRNLGRQKKM